jgi:ABC-type transporter Mla subunit MlaD
MGILNLFSQSNIKEENENLQKENQELKNEVKNLEQERLDLLNRIEDITRNLMNNPTTLVEETGKALVDLLKESNRANREVTSDMTTFNKDLQMQLEAAREKIDSLQNFLIVAARKIGNFEGMLKTSSRLELTSDEVTPLVSAWAHYEETTLNKRIKSH